jgi:hypothetical protein
MYVLCSPRYSPICVHDHLHVSNHVIPWKNATSFLFHRTSPKVTIKMRLFLIQNDVSAVLAIRWKHTRIFTFMPRHSSQESHIELYDTILIIVTRTEHFFRWEQRQASPPVRKIFKDWDQCEKWAFKFFRARWKYLYLLIVPTNYVRK